MTKYFTTLFLLLALMAFSLPSSAEMQQKKGKSPGYIVRTIPSDLNIKDKIVVENESSYSLTQVKVFLIDSKGKYVSLGSASRLKKNRKAEIRSYKDNKLSNLRGRKIAVSIVGEGQRPTSRFTIKLDDHRHDLYIEIEDK